MGIWMHLAADEESAGLPGTRAPEAGFAAIAYRWGRGAGLEDCSGRKGKGWAISCATAGSSSICCDRWPRRLPTCALL